jgi:hypothetical protein
MDFGCKGNGWSGVTRARKRTESGGLYKRRYKVYESTSGRKTANRIARPSRHPLKLPSLAGDSGWREPGVEEAGLTLFRFSEEKWISFKPPPNQFTAHP